MLKPETIKKIEYCAKKGVSVVGIASLIYTNNLESSKDFKFKTLKKLIEKEINRVNQRA